MFNLYFLSSRGVLHHYPFGMVLVGRNWEVGSGYRYGFNGKENANEINGNNNAIDFGSRIYDSRLGKWFSVDIKTTIYTSISPYVAFANNPILFIDKQGDNITVYYTDQYGITKPVLILATNQYTGSVTVTFDQLSMYPGATTLFAVYAHSHKTIESDELTESLQKLKQEKENWDAGITSVSFSYMAGTGAGVSLDLVGIHSGDEDGGLFAYLTFSLGLGIMQGGSITTGRIYVEPAEFGHWTFAGDSWTTQWGLLFTGHSVTETSEYRTDETVLGSSIGISFAVTYNKTLYIGAVVKPNQDTGQNQNSESGEYVPSENFTYVMDEDIEDSCREEEYYSD